MVARPQRGTSEKGRAPMRRPDAVVRALHTGLAVSFLGGWLTAEWSGLRAWHVALGHVLAPINDSYQDFGAGQFIWRMGPNAHESGYLAASDARRDGQAAGYG